MPTIVTTFGKLQNKIKNRKFKTCALGPFMSNRCKEKNDNMDFEFFPKNLNKMDYNL